MGADDEYAKQVRDVLAERAQGGGGSTYVPVRKLDLALERVRRPKSTAELTSHERAQLEALFAPRLLDDVLADPEMALEVAQLLFPDGRIAYHLYAWSYGIGYLMAPDDVHYVVAHGSQHDIERWEPEQRDLFFAVDAALRAAKTPLTQPLSFDWRDDEVWSNPEELNTYSRDFMRTKRFAP